MTGNTLGWVIVAFVLYLLMMIAIGAFYAKGNNNSEDYFLGGRKLNGFVAALSAQASDMSGWLLMGLPGAIYLTGVGGDGGIAIGLFIGTTLNWLFIATKLRRYTIRANNSVTLPTYFENRFHDEKKVLMAVSSITIVVFFLVYCASALSAGGQLFESVFGIDYHVALTIGALVVLVYTFLGGFTAVCVTDFIQGMLMLVGILAVPLFAYHFLTTGAEELGVTDVITFPGFQGPEEVRAAMEKSEIYLVTSDRKEGWGAVVNEAMNSGCAVVADHMIGAAPWLIRQGENGRMYRDGEEQELFRTVERLLRDPGECRRLGENAQQTIAGEWNARTAAERLIELCRKMKFLPEMSEEQEMPDAGQDVVQDITTPAPVIPQLWNDGPCSPAPVIPERSMYRRINSEQ